eukprot:SAG31_NODE_446_length_15587_cov_29.651989_4_plen_2475_part_00
MATLAVATAAVGAAAWITDAAESIRLLHTAFTYVTGHRYERTRLEVIYWGRGTRLSSPGQRMRFKERLLELTRHAAFSDDSLSDDDIDVSLSDDDYPQTTVGHVKIQLPFRASGLERRAVRDAVVNFLQVKVGQVEVAAVRDGSVRIELEIPEWVALLVCSELLCAPRQQTTILSQVGAEFELGELKGVWLHDRYMAGQLEVTVQVPQTVQQLKQALKSKGQPTHGQKAELTARLKHAIETEQLESQDGQHRGEDREEAAADGIGGQEHLPVGPPSRSAMPAHSSYIADATAERKRTVDDAFHMEGVGGVDATGHQYSQDFPIKKRQIENELAGQAISKHRNQWDHMQEAAAGAGTHKRKGSPSAPSRVKKQRDERWQALVEECLAERGTRPDRIQRVARSPKSLQLQHKILPPHKMDEVLKLASDVETRAQLTSEARQQIDGLLEEAVKKNDLPETEGGANKNEFSKAALLAVKRIYGKGGKAKNGTAKNLAKEDSEDPARDEVAGQATSKHRNNPSKLGVRLRAAKIDRPGDEAGQVAKNKLWLDKQNHQAFVLGAVAELIHNAADKVTARATQLSIEFQEVGGNDDDEDIGTGRMLFTDDGIGMNHHDINRMLAFGRNQTYGVNTDIGKYGIGFKQGSMCLAQSAVVVSRSKDADTISYGLLSNKPFEDDHRARQRGTAKETRRFICNAVTVNLDNKPIHGFLLNGESPEADFKKLMEQIEEFTSMNRIHLGEFTAKMKSAQHGTTIILDGLRKNRGTGRLQLDPGREGDFIVYQLERDLFQQESREKMHREQGKEVMADCSLRSFCEIMFNEPDMEISIRRKKVKQMCLSRELSRVEAHLIKDDAKATGGAKEEPPIVVQIGCHPMHKQMGLSGTMLYQDNALVTFYGRKFIGNDAGHIGDKHGVLLLVSLPSAEFETVHTKTSFLDAERFKQTQAKIADLYKRYVNTLENDLDDIREDAVSLDARLQPRYKWIQCSECAKWRILNLDRTLEKAESYSQQFEGRDWCCFFEGSPVECCDPPCHYDRFRELAEVVVQKPSYSPHKRAVSMPVADLTETADDEIVSSVDVTTPTAGQHGRKRQRASTKLNAVPPVAHPKLQYTTPSNKKSGQFCQVYEATYYGQPVAVKMLTASESTTDEAFLKEATALCQLRHDNIPALKAADPKQRLLVMQWVDGQTLQDVDEDQRRRHWPSWISEICTGIEYIHSHNIVHNDLRLTNIMVTTNTNKIKLIDFGLAKMKQPNDHFSTQVQMVHSAQYKCPVSAREGIVDTAVDVYALGVCVLELALEGKRGRVWRNGRDELMSNDEVCRLIMKPSLSDAELQAHLPDKEQLESPVKNIVMGAVTSTWDDRYNLQDVIRQTQDIKEKRPEQFVYHVLEPQDQMEWNRDGTFKCLSRLSANEPLSASDEPYRTIGAGTNEESLAHHVQHGSKPTFRGKFISCTESALWALHFWSSHKADADISYPIFKIDIMKVPEDSRIELTTKKECRKHALTTSATNYAVDAREVVFTNGYSDGIPAAAIVGVCTMGSRKYSFEKPRDYRNRTQMRSQLDKMVAVSKADKGSKFEYWHKMFERQMFRATAKEFLAEGEETIEALCQHRIDKPSNSGLEFGKIWESEDGPYELFLMLKHQTVGAGAPTNARASNGHQTSRNQIGTKRSPSAGSRPKPKKGRHDKNPKSTIDYAIQTVGTEHNKELDQILDKQVTRASDDHQVLGPQMRTKRPPSAGSHPKPKKGRHELDQMPDQQVTHSDGGGTARASASLLGSETTLKPIKNRHVRLTGTGKPTLDVYIDRSTNQVSYFKDGKTCALKTSSKVVDDKGDVVGQGPGAALTGWVEQLAEQLRAANEQDPLKSLPSKVMPILRDLDATKVDVDALKMHKSMGRLVRKMCKHEDEDVKELAKTLYDKWVAMVLTDQQVTHSEKYLEPKPPTLTAPAPAPLSYIERYQTVRQVVVGSSGAEVDLVGEKYTLTLTIGRGALDADTTITIGELRPASNMPAITSADKACYKRIAPVYELQPHGIQFKQSGKVTLALDTHGREDFRGAVALKSTDLTDGFWGMLPGSIGRSAIDIESFSWFTWGKWAVRLQILYPTKRLSSTVSAKPSIFYRLVPDHLQKKCSKRRTWPAVVRDNGYKYCAVDTNSCNVVPRECIVRFRFEEPMDFHFEEPMESGEKYVFDARNKFQRTLSGEGLATCGELQSQFAWQIVSCLHTRKKVKLKCTIEKQNFFFGPSASIEETLNLHAEENQGEPTSSTHRGGDNGGGDSATHRDTASFINAPGQLFNAERVTLEAEQSMAALGPLTFCFSYATKSFARVEEAKAELESRGHTVFYGKDIRTTDKADWRKQWCIECEKAQVIVNFLSAAYICSDSCAQEWNFSKNKKEREAYKFSIINLLVGGRAAREQLLAVRTPELANAGGTAIRLHFDTGGQAVSVYDADDVAGKILEQLVALNEQPRGASEAANDGGVLLGGSNL